MNTTNAKLHKSVLALMTKIQKHPYHQDEKIGTPEQLLATETVVNALDELACLLENDTREF